MLPTYKTENIETVYTFSEWEKIHNRRKSRQRAEEIYYIKQKLMGLAAVGISALELLAGYNGLINEGGAFIFLLPIGIYALFTNEKMI